MKHVTLEISGMTCGHCVASVQKALAGIAGIKVGKVEIGSATVDYDDAKVTLEQVEDAVEDQGYEVVGTQ